MVRLQTFLTSCFFLMFPLFLSAQSEENIDFFRTIGKMNVVIAVIAIIFLGIIAFMVVLDRKIKKLEEENE